MFKKQKHFWLIITLLLINAQPMNVTAHSKKNDRKINNSLTQQQIAKKLNWVSLPQQRCDHCAGYYKEPKVVTEHQHPLYIRQETTHISAAGPTIFSKYGWSVLHKNVVMTQPGRRMTADIAYIYRDHRSGKITKVRLIGHVHYEEFGKLIIAKVATFNLQNHTARFEHVIYHIAEKTLPELKHNKKFQYDAWGTATRASRDANDVIRLWHATYTTCSPLRPNWIMSARFIKLDKQKGVGKAKYIVLRLRKVPVFFSPTYSFAINKKRKTGFLGVTTKYNNKDGLTLAVPFYWNMAPNYDLTFTPRIMTLRGVMFNTLFRYLTWYMHGFIYASFIPNDRGFVRFKNNINTQFAGTAANTIPGPYLSDLNSFSNNRGFFAVNDHFEFNQKWSSDIIANYVTDPYYFRDFGLTFGSLWANQLLNEFDLNYNGLHWSFAVLLQAYQTLHLITQLNVPVNDQYQRLPELDFNASYPDIFGHVDFDLNGQIVNFVYKSEYPPFTFQQPIGQRLYLRPTISRPFVWSGGYITPLVALDSTTYYSKLALPTGGVSRPTFDQSRNLPIVNLDSGLFLQHNFLHHGHDYVFTFEPRLFYLYVPFENQNNIPNFDTNLLPFSFEQLFALNRFAGVDRLQNANQVSLGLTGRIFDATTGLQKLKAGIGVIYYFERPIVILPNASQDLGHTSPIVAQLVYYPAAYWSMTGNFAWDTARQNVNNAEIAISYSRDTYHILTLGLTYVQELDGFRFNPLNQNQNTYLISVGASWPLNHHWSAVGYWYYNIARNHPETYYLGLEYNTCCWAIRLMGSRSYVGVARNNTSGTFTNQFRTSVIVQLMLKGLGSFGNNDPSQLLASTLPGFSDPFK